MAANEEPAPGSVIAKFQICLPVPTRPRIFSCCSAVPCSITLPSVGSW
jgi:hypothetical protein